MEDTQGIHIFSTEKSNFDAIWEDRTLKVLFHLQATGLCFPL